MAVDPRDFLINTDYEMDYPAFVKEGIISPNETLLVPHGMPFYPLLFGFCSANKEFKDSKPLPYYDGRSFEMQFLPTISNKISINAVNNGPNIQITYNNTQDSSPAPMYYRIYGFEPSTVSAKIPPTVNLAKLFSLNTDNDYKKILKEGTLDYGDILVLKHDLGYIPQAMAWYELSNQNTGYVQRWYDANKFFYSTPDTLVIDFQNVSSSSIWNGAKIHYRIYYDEA